MDSLILENQKVYFHSAEKMEEIDDDSIPLVVTSPPYWDVRDYGGEQIGFNQSYEEYITGLNKVWKECLRVLQPNGKIAINVQPLPIAADRSGFERRIIKDIMFDIEKFMFSHDMYLSGMVYWNKIPYINNVSWGSYPRPTNIATNTAFEHIYTFVKRGTTRKVEKGIMEKSMLSKHEWRHWAVRMIWDDISPIIKINQKGENLFGHSAPFPEEIPYRLIRMHTVEGETVLDPFTGSGTTLKMARLSKRKGIGYEINAEYKPLIRKRILETWEPQFIDPHYKTIGSHELATIVKESTKLTLESLQAKLDEPNSEIADILTNPELLVEIQKQMLKGLKKQNLLSAANCKRIKKYWEKEEEPKE